MLSKIFSFSSRKTGKKLQETESETNWLLDYHCPFPFLEPSQIRVLVFRDCDRKGKTLLFDSKVANQSEHDRLSESPSSKTPGSESRKPPSGKTEQNSGRRTPQKYRKPSHDSKMLGEMLFGSVAMAYKGSTVKVHLIRSPHQLLLSKVFALKPRIIMPSCECSENGVESYISNNSQIDSLLDDSSTRIDPDCASLSSQNGSPKDSTLLAATLLAATSNPMAVPGTPGIFIDPEEDSGFMTSIDSTCNSIAGSVTSLYTPSSSPCGSYHRRLHRSQVTSFDSGFSKRKEEPEDQLSPVMRRRQKIGLGIIFPLSENDEKSKALQGYFFAHFPLFESHVHRLRLNIESACFSKKSFSSLVLEATTNFCEGICNQLLAARLQEPVWLNMMTFPDHRANLCEQFMEQLNGCLSECNNRETSFFFASLLTGVLTHHLAWVPTVMPAGAAPSRAYLDKHSSKTLDLLAQSHPYNPLWAQLSDLYGSIGYPLKLARTVVTGKHAKLVNQVLYILSYFIRCTEVFEHTITRDDSLVTNSSDSEPENCCFCRNEGTPDLDHEHVICSTCIEKSGMAICPDCRKIILQDLDPCIRTTGGNPSMEKNSFCVDNFVGIPSCKKCGLLRRDFTEQEIIRVNSNAGQCGCLPKWAVAKELKHFVQDLSYCERSETFKCYCCEDKDEKKEKSSFTCYCPSESCVHHKPPPNDTRNCIDKDLSNLSLELQNGENEENFTTFVKLLSNDQFCPRVECKCVQDNFPVSSSDTNIRLSVDSGSYHAISDKIDSGSLHSDKTEVESVASYGRSGSADSGFHQTPVSSPCARQRTFLDCLSMDTLEDDEDEFGPKELPLPGLIFDTDTSENCSKVACTNVKKSNSFGRSLFAGVSEDYRPDFVLQGTTNKEFLPRLSKDLNMSLKHSVVDDPLTDAVCIVADTDNWTCELVSAKKCKRQSSSDSAHIQPMEVSNLVLSMLTSVSGLWDVKMSAEFCLMHLEDRLKEIYLKSKVISEWLRDCKRPIGKAELAQTLGIDDNDIMLLLAVASAHSPQGIAYIRH